MPEGVRYLTVAEAQRLINASDLEFRPLVRAALETGCRYSELTRLEVHDFNPDTNTVAIRKSKSGKPRHVILTPEGADFFQQQYAGRRGSEIMFRHDDGTRWNKSEQSRPMKEACEHAKIAPGVSFHILRHTWASLAVMAGVPLLVVAKNLGHTDTRMVEKHYGIWRRVTSPKRSALVRRALRPLLIRPWCRCGNVDTPTTGVTPHELTRNRRTDGPLSPRTACRAQGGCRPKGT
jgi:integrase